LIGSAFAKGRDLLRGTLLFSGLSDQDADAILASAHRTRYPARATIFVKGAPGQSMMAILQGRVRISVPSSEGREAVFKIMGEGEIFGEIALLDGKERTADAVAITACELLVVERRAFLPVLRRRPELCIRLLELLCERLRRTDQQVEDLLIRHFENRLARTLLRLGGAPRRDRAQGQQDRDPRCRGSRTTRLAFGGGRQLSARSGRQRSGAG